MGRKTWVFFNEQSLESLNKSIDNFENLDFDYKMIRKHAEKFDTNIFKKNIIDFIENKYREM